MDGTILTDTEREEAREDRGRARGKDSRELEATRRRTTSGRSRAIDLLGGLLVIVGALASLATNLAEAPDEAGETDGLVACSASSDCGDDAAHCLTSYSVCVECLEDDHCDAQSRCYEHRCVERCESAESCPGELVCIEGLCRSCEADSECGDPSLYCYIGPEFNACRPLCRNSSECAGPGYVDGEVCRGGQCQQVSCRVPQDCAMDQELCDVEAGVCRSIR